MSRALTLLGYVTLGVGFGLTDIPWYACFLIMFGLLIIVSGWDVAVEERAAKKAAKLVAASLAAELRFQRTWRQP